MAPSVGYKNYTHTHCAGIYLIRNLITHDLYIGSSVKISKRWHAHRLSLRSGTHANPKLQSAWNKYGEYNFDFTIAEVLEDVELLIPREQDWIDWARASNINLYYIKDRADSPLGMKVSDETRLSLSAATTTVYLVALAGFAVAALTTYGTIRARRIR